MSYITRLDYGRTHAWWVRFQRSADPGTPRLVVSRMFSDGKHGGKAWALAAAMRYRDATLREMAPRTRRRRTLPGHGYVRRTSYAGRAVYAGWVKLDARGGSSCTKWHVDVWGERAAKRHCAEWLARKQAEVAARHAKRARARGRAS